MTVTWFPFDGNVLLRGQAPIGDDGVLPLGKDERDAPTNHVILHANSYPTFDDYSSENFIKVVPRRNDFYPLFKVIPRCYMCITTRWLPD